MDCNFELESQYSSYNCFELEGNNYKIAFMASTHHCGGILNEINPNEYKMNFFNKQ